MLKCYTHVKSSNECETKSSQSLKRGCYVQAEVDFALNEFYLKSLCNIPVLWIDKDRKPNTLKDALSAFVLSIRRTNLATNCWLSRKTWSAHSQPSVFGISLDCSPKLQQEDYDSLVIEIKTPLDTLTWRRNISAGWSSGNSWQNTGKIFKFNPTKQCRPDSLYMFTSTTPTFVINANNLM